MFAKLTVPLASDRTACSTSTPETAGNECTESSCRCTDPIRSCLDKCSCPRCTPTSPTATRASRFSSRNFLSTILSSCYMIYRNSDEKRKTFRVKSYNDNCIARAYRFLFWLERYSRCRHRCPRTVYASWPPRSRSTGPCTRVRVFRFPSRLAAFDWNLKGDVKHEKKKKKMLPLKSRMIYRSWPPITWTPSLPEIVSNYLLNSEFFFFTVRTLQNFPGFVGLTEELAIT